MESLTVWTVAEWRSDSFGTDNKAQTGVPYHCVHCIVCVHGECETEFNKASKHHHHRSTAVTKETWEPGEENVLSKCFEYIGHARSPDQRPTMTGERFECTLHREILRTSTCEIYYYYLQFVLFSSSAHRHRIAHHSSTRNYELKIGSTWRNRKWRANTVQCSHKMLKKKARSLPFGRPAATCIYYYYIKHVAVRYDLLVHDLFRDAATQRPMSTPYICVSFLPSCCLLRERRAVSVDWILTFVPSHQRMAHDGQSVRMEFPQQSTIEAENLIRQ